MHNPTNATLALRPGDKSTDPLKQLANDASKSGKVQEAPPPGWGHPPTNSKLTRATSSL